MNMNEWDESSKEKGYLSNHTVDIVNSSLKVSDLSLFELCKIIRDIVREETGRSLPNYQVFKYEIPKELGEQNQDNTRTFTTNYTVFEPHKFPMWNYGYKED